MSQVHSRFWLLQSSLHCFDLLEMTGHVRGHHHLNYQGPKLPFRDTPWREKHGSKKMESKNSLIFFATSKQNRLISGDISNQLELFRWAFFL